MSTQNPVPLYIYIYITHAQKSGNVWLDRYRSLFISINVDSSLSIQPASKVVYVVYMSLFTLFGLEY